MAAIASCRREGHRRDLACGSRASYGGHSLPSKQERRDPRREAERRRNDDSSRNGPGREADAESIDVHDEDEAAEVGLLVVGGSGGRQCGWVVTADDSMLVLEEDVLAAGSAGRRNDLVQQWDLRALGPRAPLFLSCVALAQGPKQDVRCRRICVFKPMFASLEENKNKRRHLEEITLVSCRYRCLLVSK